MVASGSLSVWHRATVATPSLPGEVGSGYKSAAAPTHVEPEEIYVLGTAHYSRRSAEEVERAIELLQPDCVVVELCRGRAGLLYADETQTTTANDRASNAFSLSGDGGALRTLLRSQSLGGWTPLLLRALLARLASQRPTSAQTAAAQSTGTGVSRTDTVTDTRTSTGTDGVGGDGGTGTDAGTSAGHTVGTLGEDFRAARRAAEAANSTLVLGAPPQPPPTPPPPHP